MLLLNNLLLRFFARKYRTLDKGAMSVLAPEKLGPKRARTPEGFVLCIDVPVARVGEMLYAAGEVPLKAGPDGLIRVTRGPDELFSEETLASYAGKPVVDDHPEDDVGPQNWKKLAIGIVLNPRRGTGDDSDVMLADLLIMDASAIRDVEAGKREVSAGYDADYEQTGEGVGRQTRILGNHVALVERGRCGPRCAIGDHQPKELQSIMSKTPNKRASFKDRLVAKFKDFGEQLAQDLPNDTDLDEGGEGATHIHIHANSGEGGTPGGEGGTKDDQTEARFQALEAGHKQIQDVLAQIMAKLDGKSVDADTDGEVPQDGGTPDEVAAANSAKTGDSVALETSFRAVMADAEVLMPGFMLPEFDPKAPRKKTMDSICALRKNVLASLAQTNDGNVLLGAIGATGADFSAMPCVTAAQTFKAAAGAKRLLNNSANTRDAHTPGRAQTEFAKKAGPRTLRELNQLHAAHYAGK